MTTDSAGDATGNPGTGAAGGLRFGTFCSGIGAPEAAWSQLGWQPQFFSEIEPFPCAVLARHFPGVQNLGDMTKITDETLSRHSVDVVCAGTPCQSFSVAGLRGGMDDARGNLAFRYVELLGSLRPTRMVWENVPGVLSSWTDEETLNTSQESRELVREVEEARRTLSEAGYDCGPTIGIGDTEEVQQTNDYDQFTAALVERGYSLAWGILDAQYFGVAQRRKRVFVVGSLGNWTDPASILFDRECLSGNPPPGREERTHVTRGADSNGDGDGAGEDGGTPLTVFDTTQVTSKSNYSNPKPGDPCHPLASAAHPPAIAIQERAVSENTTNGPGGKGWQENLAYTLESRHHVQSVAVPRMEVRRLMPVECIRLQGFPDDWLDTSPQKPTADGPKYRAIGNSMAVPVLRWIGQRIAAANAALRSSPGDTS
jgi:DNA (cytosine-5)-methyltransferase 1